MQAAIIPIQQNVNILCDESAEKYVIGAALADNKNLEIISDIIISDDLFSPLHREIYKSMVLLTEKGRNADPYTIALYIESNSKSISENKKSIEDYLNNLFREYVLGLVSTGLEERARIIKDLSQRRKVVTAIQGFMPKILNRYSSQTAENDITSLEADLYSIAEKMQGNRGFLGLSSLFTSTLERIEKLKHTDERPAIPTGFYDIDAMTSGWHKGDLVIIAGRPSMGKTAFAISVALNAAGYVAKKTQGCIGVFSLEMSAEQLTNRIVSVYSGVPSNKITNGKVTDSEFLAITKTVSQFNEIPLYIDDTPAITIASLRTKARRLKRKHGVQMLIVDYLQLLRTGENGKDNRVQEISEITQSLKAIARELEIPIIALSQLSRMVESREDKRPQLQDLRESGSIEQDADIVMFLYREAYYLERTMPGRENEEAYNEWIAKNGEKYLKIENLAEIIIGKHRNGPVGSATLRFEQKTTKFENLQKA